MQAKRLTLWIIISLFAKLIDRGLPLPVVRFLSFWYSSQKMKVRWEKSLSNPFHLSNGVRQGGVLSPVLFSVYLDSLLQKLADSGVGCHWDNLFAGAVCYADDIVLLAPCPSALRILLDICFSYADTHGLRFNAEKTQLICFHLCHTRVCLPDIVFNNVVLHYSGEVTHLGHKPLPSSQNCAFGRSTRHARVVLMHLLPRKTLPLFISVTSCVTHNILAYRSFDQLHFFNS